MLSDSDEKVPSFERKQAGRLTFGRAWLIRQVYMLMQSRSNVCRTSVFRPKGMGPNNKKFNNIDNSDQWHKTFFS